MNGYKVVDFGTEYYDSVGSDGAPLFPVKSSHFYPKISSITL